MAMQSMNSAPQRNQSRAASASGSEMPSKVPVGKGHSVPAATLAKANAKSAPAKGNGSVKGHTGGGLIPGKVGVKF